jgi:hypothetical protein
MYKKTKNAFDFPGNSVASKFRVLSCQLGLTKVAPIRQDKDAEKKSSFEKEVYLMQDLNMSTEDLISVL